LIRLARNNQHGAIRQMSNFRRLDERLSASPQITPDDIAQAKAIGVGLVINNRPEGEAPDQTPGEAIEKAAEEAGIAYLAIPIGQSGFSHAQISAMADAMASAEGQVLAYCRSGTRSTFLWALAEAMRGKDPEDLARAASRAGYDIAPIRAMIDMLSAQNR